MWHALSSLFTFFPLWKAVGSLNSVLALVQFLSVVSMLRFRTPLVPSDLRITEPRPASRPKKSKYCVHSPTLRLVLNLLISAASVYLLLNLIAGYQANLRAAPSCWEKMLLQELLSPSIPKHSSNINMSLRLEKELALQRVACVLPYPCQGIR